MHVLSLHTKEEEEFINITAMLAALVHEHSWGEGALLVHCPHTTAALTINEAADPDVQTDMCRFMGKLVPREDAFRHLEGNSDAHIKSSLFGPQVLVPVTDGALRLGTWQGVYFCEWDGPRSRQVWVQFLPGASS